MIEWWDQSLPLVKQIYIYIKLHVGLTVRPNIVFDRYLLETMDFSVIGWRFSDADWFLEYQQLSH